MRFQITTGAGGFRLGPGSVGAESSCMYCDMRNIVQSPAANGALKSRLVGVALTWIKASNVTCPDAPLKMIYATSPPAGEVETVQTSMR
ncbi:hypothetical protein [Accumulibacter sp.]|uniref:hypothetical protein n=1 Tax=Accumulibacter sp. TaxID=2053492 RepID=UPI001A530F82|nr:hypothetical protein [Accumulibacter sp.]MBL8374466.1 hypothetical protein [Accumulibacter sp.]